MAAPSKATPNCDHIVTLDPKTSYFVKVGDGSEKVDKILKFAVSLIALTTQIILSVNPNSAFAKTLNLIGANYGGVRGSLALMTIFSGLLKTRVNASECLKGNQKTPYNAVATARGLSDTWRAVCATNGMLHAVAKCGSPALASVFPLAHLVRHSFKLAETPTGYCSGAGDFDPKKGKSSWIIALSITVTALDFVLSLQKVAKFHMPIYAGLILAVLANGGGLYTHIVDETNKDATTG